MRRAGLLLAGCGLYDGSEVQETVLLVLALRKRGLRLLFLAPDVEQKDVVDHSTGEAVGDAPPRRVLLEAARITRGLIRTLAEVAPEELDALVIPGGLGVVKNLCVPGPGLYGDGPVRPEVADYLDRLAARKVPVAAIGLAEVVLARHQDRPLRHEPLAMAASQVVLDDERRVVFTPGFMGSDDVTEVAQGIDRLADEICRFLGMPPPGLRVRQGAGT
jgi:enhancing lycopene biosynthesis protein 2